MYEKDKAFYKYHLDLEDKNVLYESKGPKKSVSFYTPFVEQRKDIDRSSALYSIKAPFELRHADIADIRFFSKLAVDQKYCLLAVDLFSSKTYTYPMKSRHLFAQKMRLFYSDIQPKRQQVAKNERMRMQVDLEFQQNEIKRLNEKYNVEMFSSRVRGGKAYAAEQKTREFKKLLFKNKKAHKETSTSARFDLKKLIRKATANMNNIQSQKYGYPPKGIEENAIRSEKCREIYNFYRILKLHTQIQKKTNCYVDG